jgi:tetratricopeptide (TPR) repeat protein
MNFALEPPACVTKYYPFLEEENKKLVESFFTKSDNYYQFATSFVDTVLADPNPSEEKILLAVRIAWLTLDINLVLKLGNTFENHDNIQPWVLWGLHTMGLKTDIENTERIMDRVIESISDDSIILESLILKAFVTSSEKPKEALQTLEKANNIIESKNELMPFKPFLLAVLSDIYYNLDNYSLTEKTARQAVEKARQHNNQQMLAFALTSIGTQDAHVAIEALNEASEIYSTLGIVFFKNVIENNLGYYYVTLGQYDKAIEHYEKAVEMASERGILTYLPIMNLAVLYGNIGQIEKATNYATRALKVANQSDPNAPSPKIEMARALILQGEFDDAFEYLETGGQLAFEQGSKKEQSRYYLVRGTLERERGNLKSAVQAFQKAVRLAEDIGNIYHILRSLFNLAEAEIAIYSESEDKGYIDSSSLALSRIEQIANEQNMPGLVIQALGLKADLYKIKGKKETARSLVEKALKICDKSKITVMRNDLVKRLDELDKKEFKPSLIQRFKSLIRSITVPQAKPKPVKYNILGCILIMRGIGLEVFSKYIDEKLKSDPSLVAGLISAVSGFAKELREDAKGELESIVHHDIAVLLEHGNYVTCALLSDKDTYSARILAQRFLEKFEEVYDDFLKEFDGVAQPLDAENLFQTIVIKRNFETI